MEVNLDGPPQATTPLSQPMTLEWLCTKSPSCTKKGDFAQKVGRYIDRKNK